jgi:hypothetical protein
MRRANRPSGYQDGQQRRFMGDTLFRERPIPGVVTDS